jgi:TolB protein
MRHPTALLFAGCLLLTAAPAGAQEGRQYTEITGTGQSLFRIAIPPVLDGGGAATAARTATDVMNRDLTLIGLFKVLNPKSFLANLAQEGVALKLEPWVNVGAQAVVKARATSVGRQVNLDFYLYDLSKGTAPVLTKSYRGKARKVRFFTHKFDDAVYAYYTKERGIFTTKITFATTSRKSRTSYIYVMDYDGYGVYKVSRTGRQNVLPAWSPRGQIAYTAYLWRNSDLYLVSGSGGRAKRISKYPGLNTGAAFSPSGSSIAVTLSKDGNAEIYLIGLDGSIKRRLTNSPGIDTSPAWSPDGGRIAFVSNRGGSPQIHVMSSGGGGVRRLTYQGNYNQEPSWCPRKDNPVVAFTGRDEGGAYDIFTVNVNSGEMKRLTQGQGSNKSPTWAPNGRLLAFVSSRGGLWVMNDQGFNQHRLYRGGAQTPDWSK